MSDNRFKIILSLPLTTINHQRDDNNDNKYQNRASKFTKRRRRRRQRRQYLLTSSNLPSHNHLTLLLSILTLLTTLHHLPTTHPFLLPPIQQPLNNIITTPLHSTPLTSSSSSLSHFNNDIRRVTSRNTTSAPYKALSMLRHMSHLHSTYSNKIKPTIVTYQLVLESFVPLAGIKEDVEDICRGVYKEVCDEEFLPEEEEEERVRIDEIMFEILTRSFHAKLLQKRNNDYSSLLSEDESLCEELSSILSSLPPASSLPLYPSLIKSWSKCGYPMGLSPYAARRVEEILSRYESLVRDDDDDVDEMTECYNAVMRGYLHSKGSLRKRCLDIFQRCKTKDANSYITTIVALSRDARENTKTGDDDLTETWNVMRRLLNDYYAHCQKKDVVIPIDVPYHAIISSHPTSSYHHHRSSRLATSHALSMLSLMTLHSRSYPSLRPTVVTYNAVMTACRYNLTQVSRLWDDIHSLGLHPDGYSYSIIIHSYARAGRPEKAEGFLRDVEQEVWDATVDTGALYGMVINAYVKANRPSDAYSLLQSMETTTTTTPDVIAYTNVMEAYANEGDVDRVLSLYAQLTSFGKKKLKPNGRTYAVIILAYARSRREGCAANARRVLEAIRKKENDGNNNGVRVTIHAYNYVLMACANEPPLGMMGGRGEDDDDGGRMMTTLRILSKTYKEILSASRREKQQGQETRSPPSSSSRRRKKNEVISSIRPDSYTFAYCLKAIVHLLPQQQQRQQRDKLLKSVFEDARREGMVSSTVLFRFMRGYFYFINSSSSGNNNVTIDGVLLVEGMTVKDLPREWTRNVR